MPDLHTQHPPYLWDYEFRAVLEGRLSLGKLDQDWAAVRLIRGVKPVNRMIWGKQWIY